MIALLQLVSVFAFLFVIVYLELRRPIHKERSMNKELSETLAYSEELEDMELKRKKRIINSLLESAGKPKLERVTEDVVIIVHTSKKGDLEHPPVWVEFSEHLKEDEVLLAGMAEPAVNPYAP